MATASNPSDCETGTDKSPLLGTRVDETGGGGSRLGTVAIGLHGAAQFLRKPSSRRTSRDTSAMLEEAFARRLEETIIESRRIWKATLIYELLFYSAFLVIAALILYLSSDENPSKPLRLWIWLYTLPCVVHLLYSCAVYRQRVIGSVQVLEAVISGAASFLMVIALLFAFSWWIVGICWVSADGQAAHDSPLLYWTIVVFLGFDLVYYVIHLVLSFIPIALFCCCCGPYIAAMLRAP